MNRTKRRAARRGSLNLRQLHLLPPCSWCGERAPIVRLECADGCCEPIQGCISCGLPR